MMRSPFGIQPPSTPSRWLTCRGEPPRVGSGASVGRYIAQAHVCHQLRSRRASQSHESFMYAKFLISLLPEEGARVKSFGPRSRSYRCWTSSHVSPRPLRSLTVIPDTLSGDTDLPTSGSRVNALSNIEHRQQ